jgi:zinc-finger of acetyl-transferase ESCO
MAARITAAEAKKLGIDVKGKKRTTRKVAKAAYLTVCKTCGERFTTAASEDRHVHDTHHARYELVLK